MGTRTQVAGIFLIALLYQSYDTYAGCFTGYFEDERWVSLGCTIKGPKDAATQCLAGKHLLFIGGSTTRNIFQVLCDHLGLQVHHHPCNMYMGWGCHDCYRGCRTPGNIESRRADWLDAYATTGSGTHFAFTWKPEMLTADDITFLRRFPDAKDNPVDAVILHKGIHEAINWQQQLKPSNYSLKDFELETSARAEILAELLRERFPKSTLFWRDAYYNGKDDELEGINIRLEGVLKAQFSQYGFHILPGHHVSRNSSKEYHNNNDGLHPHESVSDVMISMLASVLCP